VRWPEPGQVMPDLVRRLGAEASAQLYEAFIGDLIAGMPLASYKGFLYALDHVLDFRDRYKGVQVRAQQGSNEGKRLFACFQELLEVHPLAVIVGSSMPDLHPRMWKSAFEMLERRDVVVGPTDRGGIYLLGCASPSTSTAESSGGRARSWSRSCEPRSGGLNYGFFPTRRKIEVYDDLAPLRSACCAPWRRSRSRRCRSWAIGQEKEVG
jgi:glycosyltransferase A (GT-A) superfamily protein (DUF2064 family)